MINFLWTHCLIFIRPFVVSQKCETQESETQVPRVWDLLTKRGFMETIRLDQLLVASCITLGKSPNFCFQICKLEIELLFNNRQTLWALTYQGSAGLGAWHLAESMRGEGLVQTAHQ